MAGCSSKMELKDLPIELKEFILCKIDPGERRHLRLVSKMMRNAVDRSMSDVKKIVVVNSPDDYRVEMRMVHPCTGEIDEHDYDIAHSSVSPLLRWAGLLTETIRITSVDEPHMESVRRVLGVLNTTDACRKVEKLRIDWTGYVDNYAVVFRYLLEYVTKRQLEAKLVEDELTRPFLRSLVLETDIHPREQQHLWLLRDQMYYLLQLIMDQCDGLKELKMDGVLDFLSLPVAALRYPMTLTHLKITGRDDTPGELHAIVANCPNLQYFELDSALLCEEANVNAIASLSDLRQLVIYDTEWDYEGMILMDPVELIERCLMAFDDHPFGAVTARPWPQLSTITLSISRGRIEIRGADRWVTSLLLTSNPCYDSGSRVEAVHQVFKVLNRTNACPKLKELKITSCPLDLHEADSSILSDLLMYFSIRQSQVKTGTPFLHSLSLSQPLWCNQESSVHRSKLSGKLDEMRSLLQNVFDQSHGLEKLEVADLMKVMRLSAVALRYPRTLTSLKTAPLCNSLEELRTIIANCPNLKTINKNSVEFLIRAFTDSINTSK